MNKSTAPIHAGLCSDCLHAKKIRTEKEGGYILCKYSRGDSSYPKYPRLPVRDCKAFIKKNLSQEELP
jgi:hypothetical protein